MDQIFKKLESLEKMIQQQSILHKEVLDFEEACLYTKRSKQNMYKLTSGNKIPHYKPEGKFIYFKRSQLDAEEPSQNY